MIAVPGNISGASRREGVELRQRSAVTFCTLIDWPS
jgi:hypothetical protein